MVADAEVVGEGSGIGVECPRCQPEIGLELDPRQRIGLVSELGTPAVRDAGTVSRDIHIVHPSLHREGFPAPLPRDHYYDYWGILFHVTCTALPF